MKRKTHALLTVTNGTITLILPLEVMTKINPSNSSGVTDGAIVGSPVVVTKVAMIE